MDTRGSQREFWVFTWELQLSKRNSNTFWKSLHIFVCKQCHFCNTAIIILLKTGGNIHLFFVLCSLVVLGSWRKKVSFLMFVSGAAAGSRSTTGYFGERIRAWEGQRGLSFLQNMELRGGELLVPRAGLYYIYAQTYFRLASTGDPETEEGAELVQYIYKKVQLLLHTFQRYDPSWDDIKLVHFSERFVYTAVLSLVSSLNILIEIRQNKVTTLQWDETTCFKAIHPKTSCCVIWTEKYIFLNNVSNQTRFFLT